MCATANLRQRVFLTGRLATANRPRFISCVTIFWPGERAWSKIGEQL